MKIISRYMLRHFFPVFSLALFAFLGLYLIIDFFENVDELLDKHVPLMDSCRYFLYKMPSIATQGIPMAVLLATLIGLGILNRNRELIALKAAGISPAFCVRPIIVSALLISIVHFGVGETVARTLNQRSQQIWQEDIKHKKASLTWMQENVWYHGQDVIYQIRLYDKRIQTLEKVSIFYLDDQFKLRERLDAKRLRWKDGHWLAEDGLALKFEEGATRQEWFDESELDLKETPKDFEGLAAMPEELGWLSLYSYTDKIRQEGYNSAPFEVELHLRAAFPLTSLILSLLGVGIAMRQGPRAGIAFGVGVALLMAFLYLTVLQTGCALAKAGILTPLVGVWTGNVLFAAVAAYLWTTQRC